ncbi:hypothetical protein SAMN05421639_101916 [Chryseobacterium shigense]|uniref:Uncharacterized protein n=1 Tax=Chryseobacterium shigense TaxID=297244 RepID=A0A1N7I044_9FLAO|nr:hypothetical protein [Chryseobacterium shigense]SIS30455.1 hypothetical protein SAMN05421639_101916 [Chryseobacterium shigense]
MKSLTYILLIMVAFHANTFAQALKSYTITHIMNKTIDKGEYVDDRRIDKKDKVNTNNLIYILNTKKDSIAFYDFNDSPISEKTVPSLCTLTKNQNILLLTYKNESYSTKLNIAFSDKEQTVIIGDKDIFYLNNSYYKYVRKNIGDHLNIPTLIDFLDDFLINYNLDDLKYISSYEKYRHKDFRVIKGYMESYRTQASDYLDKWNVKFSYNEAGVPKYILKESTEGDKELEKKLVSSNKGVFKYIKHTNAESRLITDSEILIDINKNSYEEKVTSFQVGIGKETRYEIKPISYKSFPSREFILTSDHISKMISSK